MHHKSVRFNRLQVQWKAFLTTNEQSVIDQLLFRSNIEGYTYFHTKTIGKECNLNRTTVGRIFAKFSSFIEKHSTSNWDAYFTFNYDAFILWVNSTEVCANSTEVCANSTEVCANSTLEVIKKSNNKEVIEENNKEDNKEEDNTEISNRKVLGNQPDESNWFYLDLAACGFYNNLDGDLESDTVETMQGNKLTHKEKQVIYNAFLIASGRLVTINSACGSSVLKKNSSITSTMPTASSENTDIKENGFFNVGNASTAPAAKWAFSFSKNKPSPQVSMHGSAENINPPLPRLPRCRDTVFSQFSPEGDIGDYNNASAVLSLASRLTRTLVPC